MTIKTILVAPIYEAQVESLAPSHALTGFAMTLAGSNGAHLNICIGVGRLALPSAMVVPDVRGLLNQHNDEHMQAARAFGEEAVRLAQAEGASASLQLLNGDYATITQQITGCARTSDISLVQPGDRMFALAQAVIEELLFNSGRPVIVVPPDWAGSAEIKRIVLAWDGSAKAARAIGDAMALIDRAEEIEIVTVEGDANQAKMIPGIDIAPHIARHARNVHLTSLNAHGGDIADAIRSHVAMTRADLLVMGAYGHARLRQFILGGVTQDFLAKPPVPVFLSY